MSDSADLTLEGLAHDLKNVFDTIEDVAEQLRKDSPNTPRLAGRLERSVTRATRILSSFVEQSQASLDTDLILDAATEFARDFLLAMKGPRIEFVRDIEPGLRLTGNPANWDRVFGNLFLNAGQAMPDGGTVEIRAARTPAGITITVADDGPGISPKILPRIFEPGFSTRAKRTGLGLHIVKTLVEREGGTITAANRYGAQGAEFQILIARAET